jgi:hypothetical protein
MDQQLIKRIALQEYTQGEAAGMLGLSLRNCIRQYGYALDLLTEMFLEAKMLEPLKSCQGGVRRGNQPKCFILNQIKLLKSWHSYYSQPAILNK